MQMSVLLMAAMLAAGPQIEATRFDRTVATGELVEINNDQIVVTADSATVKLAVGDIRSIAIPAFAPSVDVLFGDPPPFRVSLRDGSSIACQDLAVTRKMAKLTTESLGEVSLSVSQLRAFRLGNELDQPAEVNQAWNELLKRDVNFDLLVVRKGDVLDFVEGTAGDITDKTVSFLLGERPVSLPRERLFGLIYSQANAPSNVIDAEILVARDVLQVQRLGFDAAGYQIGLNGGTTLRVPADQVHGIRYVGRVRFLDEMEPAIVYPERVRVLQEKLQGLRNDADRKRLETEIRLATMSLFRVNTASNGDRLQIGSDLYSPDRGVWLHSGVSAMYRVNRDYRRLSAVVGMDHNSLGGQLSPSPKVHLTIVGDRVTLFDEVLEWNGASRVLDIHIEGVRDLEFRAERVPDAPPLRSSAEHVSLGNLRVLK